MKEPKIRFKGFSGEWEIDKIGNFSTSFSGGTPNAGVSAYYGGNIPFIRSGEIHEDKTELSLTEEGYNNSSAKIVEKGTLLYALYGATSGDVAISKIRGAINQAILAITPYRTVETDFLADFLLCNKYKIVGELLQGGQGNLSGSLVKDINVAYPCISEQQSIASFFQHLDSLVQSTTKKIESLKQVKAASLQSMFPQEGETTPRVRFKGFEGEWEKVKVRDIFYITRGYVLAMNLVSLTKNRINRYAVYSSQTKNNGLAGYYNNYLYEDSITWTTDGANAGDVNYRPGKFYCTNVCGVLISKEGYANKCIAECLNLVTKHYVSYVGNPKLMNNTMSEIDILIPPIQKEQQKISDYFTSLDRQITLQTQRLEKLKQIKAACLDNMFV